VATKGFRYCRGFTVACKNTLNGVSDAPRIGCQPDNARSVVRVKSAKSTTINAAESGKMVAKEEQPAVPVRDDSRVP